MIKLPIIVSDIAIAVTVFVFLGRRGVDDKARLWTALVALGPSFILISGIHGQLDSLAILLAVIAVAVWHEGGDRRALFAGPLINMGTTLKTVPILVILALLPTARSKREATTLLGASAVIPALAIAPFFLTEPRATIRALRYFGVPGAGGSSLVNIYVPMMTLLWVAFLAGFVLAVRDIGVEADHGRTKVSPD